MPINTRPTPFGDRPARLEGDFTAERFGNIMVSEGAADFEVTATAEAWQLGDQPAFDSIQVPSAQILSQALQVNPGVELGEIMVGGAKLDYEDPDGLVLADGYRVETFREGFDFQLHVIPATWRNPKNHLDTDDNGLITPFDVLRIINDLNAHGARPLERPSVRTAVPPDFIDVNGDQFATPNDVLLVINYLNSVGADAEGEEPVTHRQDVPRAVVVDSVRREAVALMGDRLANQLGSAELTEGETVDSAAIWPELSDAWRSVPATSPSGDRNIDRTSLEGIREHANELEAILEAIGEDVFRTQLPY